MVVLALHRGLHRARRDGGGGQGSGPRRGSLEANKLSWFVLSRVSDFRIYEEYQAAGFDMDAAKKLVLSVVQDSSAYEVK